MKEAKNKFLEQFPQFVNTRIIDELRQTEYERLDRLGHIYLDYTGGGLYADSQIHAHSDLLLKNVFGNPHSSNPTSIIATELVDQARAYVLEFFNASPDEYVCIFTQNASGALKLIGESYPFSQDSTYLLTFDNHNSVNGIREFAHTRGAHVVYSPITLPDMRLDLEKLKASLFQTPAGTHQLFAYPAQSNFSGVQHPLELIDFAHEKGWDVLLDAAAYVPTNYLDLSKIHPDFISLSFYKIFGYPTGVGALIARHDAMEKLHRPWFAGGTITVASVQGNRYYLHQGAEGYEDGTLNYLSLPAVEFGLRHIAKIGYDPIHTRVTCLTQYLLDELLRLRHSNGAPLVRIYGPANIDMRGGTVTFNFYDPNRHFIDHRRVEARANEHNISLRTGCFCNPGGGEIALGLTSEQLNSCFIHHRWMTADDFRRCIDDTSTGAVRISLGLVTTFEDVYHLIRFACSLTDQNAANI
ncbi:MAG: aminotransferase class V-fold PLP-dependent enzyme [Chloroflexota bacterium]